MKIAVCVGSRQQGSSLGFIKELLSLRVLWSTPWCGWLLFMACYRK